MNQYLLQKDCKELHAFPHIIEFAFKKINAIQFDSLKRETSALLRFYYIVEGRFDWIINDHHHILFPGDLVVVLPGQYFGAEKDFLEIGAVSWIHLELQNVSKTGTINFGKWSRLATNDCKTIGRILTLNSSCVLSRFKEGLAIFQTIQNEFVNQEIGYSSRINQQIDELIILVIRQLTRQSNSRRDFPQAFMKLEQALRDNLAHQWTIEEMSALVGLGATAFTEKVKSFTGFSPLNYLINIRVSEAIKLLKKPEIHVTDIALEVGFYSSQHFATTFKKLTGYTPSEFKKKNSTDNS